jgi:hypothetical protein
LTVKEEKGFSFRQEEGDVARAKTVNYLSGYNGSLEWIISNTEDYYTIGYTNYPENVNDDNNDVYFGLRKVGLTLYINESQKMRVSIGDTIKISKNMTTVSYWKNGTVVEEVTIPAEDRNFHFYGLVVMPGISEVQNVQATGFTFTENAHWDRTEYMQISRSLESSVVHPITLEDSCTENLRSGEQITGSTSPSKPEENQLSIYTQKDKPVQVRLTLSRPETVSFTVYTLTGVEIRLIENRIPQKTHEIEFDLPVSGAYIIKAITATGEYSKKIIIN